MITPINTIKKQTESLKGVWTALITPMKKEGDPTNLEVDFEKYEGLINEQIDAGVHGLLILGTTGQAPTFSDEEHIEVFTKALDYIDGRVPVMVGASSNATNQAFNLSETLLRHSDKAKIKPILLHATGYYNKPTQAGIFQHYEYLAEHLNTGIMIYNVPGRTKSDIEVETIIELSKLPNIIGVKYAKEDAIDSVEKIVKKTCYDDFRVMSGNCGEFYDFLKAGASGVISATANVVPSEFLKIYNLYIEGKVEESEKIQIDLTDMIESVFLKDISNPQVLNFIFDSGSRSPLKDISDFKRYKYTDRKFYDRCNSALVMCINPALKELKESLLPMVQEIHKDLLYNKEQ